MKLSRTLIFWTIFVFFLLRLALSAEHQNVTELPSITESVFKSELLRKLDLSKIFEEASNEIGLPFGLRQTLIETLREKGFLNLSGASYLFNKDRTDESSARDGHGGGGCSDSFAVFGFLAFLLALADLLIDLGVIMAPGRRRKRSNGGSIESSRDESSCQDEYRTLALREGTIASYSLLRGFLNAMDAHDATCSDRFMCEATLEASLLGKIGLSFAKVASPNAKSWLEHIDPSLHFGAEAAGLTGIELGMSGQKCQDQFPCSKIPKSYKFPGFVERK